MTCVTRAAARGAFRRFRFDAVVHLAGLKAVGESVAEPLRYYDVNVGGAVALLEAMRRHGVGRLVFSSSATVYGTPDATPIAEDAPLGGAQPLRPDKSRSSAIIGDLAAARPDFAAVSLRYFNPVGAHASGLIGEDPRGVPNNLFPFIAQTAAGHARARCGSSATTIPRRTGRRARLYPRRRPGAGALAALDFLLGRRRARAAHVPINLGCGRGYSVLEAVEAFAAAIGRRRSRSRSSAVGPATWPNASPIRAGRRSCSGGGRSSGSRRCVPTTGHSRADCRRADRGLRSRRGPARPDRGRRRRPTRRRRGRRRAPAPNRSCRGAAADRTPPRPPGAAGGERREERPVPAAGRIGYQTSTAVSGHVATSRGTNAATARYSSLTS